MLPEFSRTSIKSDDVTSNSVSNSPIDLRFLIAIIILSISLIGTGLLFLLNFYFKSNIEMRSLHIDQVVESIDIKSIEKLLILDRKIFFLKSSETISSGHKEILDAISRIVIPGVRYKNLDIIVNDQQSYEVEIKGVSNTLITYLQQIAALDLVSGLAKGIELKDYRIDVNDAGLRTVKFTLGKSINISELNRKQP